MLYTKKEGKGYDSTTAIKSSSMDSTPADTTYITHTHTQTQTHTTHSKSNDRIHRKRWRQYRFR